MKSSRATPVKKVDYAGLKKSLEKAVAKRIPAKGKVGVAFSGGIDSGIIAFLVRKKNPNTQLLAVGTSTSLDFIRAEAIAKKWKVKLVKKVLDKKEITAKYALAGKILKTSDHLQKTIGVVNLSVAELAHENGIQTLFVGSGADELFCGYAVFEECRNDTEKCEKLRTQKVENVEEHDVQREKKCARHYSIEVQAPYLDADFAERALKVPALQNLTGKYGKLRKNTLRVLGEKLKLPKEMISAPKKAMQYGSGVAKALN